VGGTGWLFSPAGYHLMLKEKNNKGKKEKEKGKITEKEEVFPDLIIHMEVVN
jgi:hypothetical protein